MWCSTAIYVEDANAFLAQLYGGGGGGGPATQSVFATDLGQGNTLAFSSSYDLAAGASAFNDGPDNTFNNAFDSLSSPCQGWLQSSGINLQAFQFNGNNITWYNATTYPNMTIGSINGTSDQTTLAQFTSNGVIAQVVTMDGLPTNNVVLGGSYYSGMPGYSSDLYTSQEIILLHEALHVTTSQGDLSLAQTLTGVPYTDPVLASGAISTTLAGCVK